MADVTTTQNSGLPSWATGYGQGFLQRAQQVADSPYQAYTQPRVADMAPWQTQAYQAQAQRAMSGSPVMNAANSQLQSTISGANLNGNPYLQTQIDQAQGDMARNWNNVQKPAWDTSMQRSGSFGNSGIMQANQEAQNQLQQNMGRIGSDMRFQNYNAERGYQQQAMSMAPAFAQQDYNDIGQLQQAGAAYQTQNQRQLDNAYSQFLDSRQYPQQQLDIFGNALGRIQGNVSTQTSPGTSTGAQVVGGLATGAGLYNLLFGGG
jgi:hypothetical protein